MNIGRLARGQRVAELTTDSPQSSHGIPVLRFVSDADPWAGDYGPGDALPDGAGTAADWARPLRQGLELWASQCPILAFTGIEARPVGATSAPHDYLSDPPAQALVPKSPAMVAMCRGLLSAYAPAIQIAAGDVPADIRLTPVSVSLAEPDANGWYACSAYVGETWQDHLRDDDFMQWLTDAAATPDQVVGRCRVCQEDSGRGRLYAEYCFPRNPWCDVPGNHDHTSLSADNERMFWHLPTQGGHHEN